MIQVNIYEAKTRLSELVEQVRSGESVVIARAGQPLVTMVPWSAATKKIKFGLMKGKLEVADDFDAPLPEAVQAAFDSKIEP